MLQIFVSNLLEINPNSIANVQKVFKHIDEISEIKYNRQKWIIVICNSVLYYHIQKIKKNFFWFILISDALHKEINILKTFIKLN